MSNPAGPPQHPSDDYPPSPYGQGGYPSGGDYQQGGGGYQQGGGAYQPGGGAYQQGGGLPPSGYPGGTPFQPAPQRGTSKLAVTGLVLFWLPFVGLLLSFVALFTTGGRRKRGRGLAAIGLVLSLLVTGSTVTAFVVLKDKVKNISTIGDPGCIAGKDIVLKNADLGGGTDPVVVKAKLQVLITGLDAAAKSSQNDSVRSAMTALANDYRQVLAAINAGKGVPDESQAKVETDANRIDELCTLGGAQK